MDTKQTERHRQRAEAFCRRRRPVFRDDEDLLRTAESLFALNESAGTSDRAETPALIERMTRKLYKAAVRSQRCRMAKAIKKHELKRKDVLLLLALALSAFGMSRSVYDVDDLQNVLETVGVDRFDVIRRLRPGGRLMRSGWLRMGRNGLPAERHVALQQVAAERLLPGLRVSAARKSEGPDLLCKPKVKLSDLVLAPEVGEALEMAIAQEKNRKRLLKTWKLGRIAPYGRGLVLLFSGPPGVGKTAAAQALASALSRKIMVVDYTRVQDAWLGETEKNIAHAFAEAKKQDAVLFWDEADSMLYSRAETARSWEVQHVNVLLQELEKFEGTCILATNRRTSMDEALGRRVGIKVEFSAPDRAMRRSLWRKMLPKALPLEDEVSPDALSAAELTGGQIKNVVFNAARRALTNQRPQVALEDFETAIAMEVKGDWTSRGRIGFRQERQGEVRWAGQGKCCF